MLPSYVPSEQEEYSSRSELLKFAPLPAREIMLPIEQKGSLREGENFLFAFDAPL